MDFRMSQRSTKRRTPAPSHPVLLSQAIDLDQAAVQRFGHVASSRTCATFSRAFSLFQGAIKPLGGHCLRAYWLCIRVLYDWCVLHVVSGMLCACPGQECDCVHSWKICLM
jgi:hypothetical protein